MVSKRDDGNKTGWKTIPKALEVDIQSPSPAVLEPTPAIQTEMEKISASLARRESATQDWISDALEARAARTGPRQLG